MTKPPEPDHDPDDNTVTGYKGASTIRTFATRAITPNQPLIALVTEEILWAGGSRHGRVDLTPEAARDLRDQLTQLLHDHYLGTAHDWTEPVIVAHDKCYHPEGT